MRIKIIRTPTEDVPLRHHAGAGDTERAAAAQARPRAGTVRMKCLEAFMMLGPMTSQELAQALGRSPHQMNQVSPRIKELCDGGFLEDTGRRRETLSNAQAIVWWLTPAGLEALGRKAGGPLVTADEVPPF